MQSTLWFEYLAGVLISTQSAADLRRHNPYLSDAQCSALLTQTAEILFTCIRLSQLNRCISKASKLASHIEKLALRKLQDSDTTAAPLSILQVALQRSDFNFYMAKEHVSTLCDRLLQLQQACGKSSGQCLMVLHHTDFDQSRSEAVMKDVDEFDEMVRVSQQGCLYKGTKLFDVSLVHCPAKRPGISLDAMCHILDHSCKDLAKEIGAERVYVDQESDQSFLLDPRFLVFEFLSGFLLRDRQVELVRDFVSSHSHLHSRVEQMIMGQGKTTVIAPLLAMMLASSESLIMQVVPAALLEQSRGVLRKLFSSVIQKPVVTFTFDRASKDTETPGLLLQLLKKLQRARATRSVVIATPESVKSCMLKYVDLLHLVQNAPQLCCVPMNKLSTKQQRTAKDTANEYTKYAECADLLKQVVALWGAAQNGVALLDEVDMVLHPLKSELNYPIGTPLSQQCAAADPWFQVKSCRWTSSPRDGCLQAICSILCSSTVWVGWHLARALHRLVLAPSRLLGLLLRRGFEPTHSKILHILFCFYLSTI